MPNFERRFDTVLRVRNEDGAANTLFAGDGSDATTWSALEVSMGLLCVSAPTLRPLFREVHRVFSLSGSRSQSSAKFYARRSNSQIIPQTGYVPGRSGDAERHQIDDGLAQESTTELIAFPFPAKLSSGTEHQGQESLV